MMSFLEAAVVIISCLVIPGDMGSCANQALKMKETEVLPAIKGVAEVSDGAVLREGAIDVQISAEGVIVWDYETGQVLYETNGNQRRPVASLSKLIAALLIREELELWKMVEIPSEVLAAQRAGANIELPVGGQASVADLLAAGMIASANDAMVSLAVSGFGSEEALVKRANEFAAREGWQDTVISNATGLTYGEQYSTPRDLMGIFGAAYSDPYLAQWLAEEGGILTTQEGMTRSYKSTNKLLGTYLPVLAAKTGYTIEAGENLVLMTRLNKGRVIGAAVLGSEDRFYDMKALVGWIEDNYSWGE